MKCLKLISSLILIISCKKDYTSSISQRSDYPNTNKFYQRFLNDLETTCPIDTIAFASLEKWRSYLKDCVTFDSSYSDNIPAGKYSIRIKFEVSKNGKAINPEVINDPGYGLAQKALEIFYSFKGQWPYLEEEDSREYLYQPIIFEIADE